MLRRVIRKARREAEPLLLGLHHAFESAVRPAAAVPRITAKAACVIDAATLSPILAKNARFRLPPASLIKLALATVVIRKELNLETQVEIVSSDLVRGSTMGLRAGDVVTVDDLLHGLLLASGNDAAQALGRLVGEPVTAMNDLARSLGMSRTHFVNPSGLHAPGQFSTAYDLALLSTEAFSIERLREICGTRRYQVNFGGDNPRSEWLSNTLALLGRANVIAGKTGSTRQARGCLALSARVGARECVAVLLGSAVEFDAHEVPIPASERRYDDAEVLLGTLG